MVSPGSITKKSNPLFFSGITHECTSKYKPLTSVELLALGKRVLEQDEEARNILVLHNLRLVFRMARKWLYVAKVGKNATIEYADLVQYGVLGLMEAAQRWDYRKGIFFTYAEWWIKCMLTRAVMESDVIQIPARIQLLCFHVLQTAENFMRTHGKLPDAKEIAEKLDSTESKVKGALEAMHMSKTMSSLEDKVPGYSNKMGEEEVNTFQSIIACDRFLQPDQALEAKQTLAATMNRFDSLESALAFSKISEKNQKIFKERYGLNDGTFTKRGIAAIARAHGISGERVRQIILLVWEKLRKSEFPKNQGELLTEFERYRELESIVAAT